MTLTEPCPLLSWFVTFPKTDGENQTKYSEVKAATYPEAVARIEERYGVKYGIIYADNDNFRARLAKEGLTLRETLA